MGAGRCAQLCPRERFLGRAFVPLPSARALLEASGPRTCFFYSSHPWPPQGSCCLWGPGRERDGRRGEGQSITDTHRHTEVDTGQTPPSRQGWSEGRESCPCSAVGACFHFAGTPFSHL